MKTIVSTDKAPAAIGPYSQGIKVGNLLFTSGQIPLDPATGTCPEGIQAQARQSLTNVKAILAEAGVEVNGFPIRIGEEYGIDYVEEAPIWQTFTRESMVAANDGYKLVPCASLFFENEWCHEDLADYYKSGALKENILGYMTAPWVKTQNENVDTIIAGIKALAAAREKYYGK